MAAMTIKVMSCDPGVTSGYTYALVEPKQYTRYYPFQMLDDVDDFWRRLREFKPRYLIMEDFEFRQGRQRTGINLFPKELIGVGRLYSLIADHDIAFYLQKAATGKAYYSDKVMKAGGFMNYGDASKLGHGIDASRHLLQWLTFGAGSQFAGTKGSAKDFVQRLDSWPMK